MTPVAPLWKRLWKSFGYVVATVLTTASFVLLHHIGNQTPFVVVAEKVAAEFDAEPEAWGTRREHGHNPWEYCFLTGAVLAGSASSTTPFHDAVRPRTIAGDGTAGDFCPELRRWAATALAGGSAAANSELPRRRVMLSQWVGSKALYAIGLRFLTVHEYHEFIRKATYCAFAMLALAVAPLGWRAMVVAGPLLIFGATLSGVEYLSDVAKGTPYAWAIFSAAVVALMLRFPAVPASATRLFCFVAGMVAGYLWLFDGANFAAAVLIGLVAWLRYAPLAPRARAARSAACVFAHAAGFALSVVLCHVVRLGDASSWFHVVAKDTRRIFAPEERDILGKDTATWSELVELNFREATLLIDATVIALGTALIVVGYRAWQRDWRPVKEALGIGVLALAPLAHFLLPNDNPYAAARLMYLPLALCWSVLATVLLCMSRPVHAFAFLGIGGALLGTWLVWQHTTTTALVRALDSTPADPRIRLVAHDYFDVYLKDGRQLIYHRDPCEEVDVKRWFVLNVYPKYATDLPADRADREAEEITIHLIHNGLFAFGQEGCTLVVDLPTYPIAKIETHRYCCYEGERHWHIAHLDLERAAAFPIADVPAALQGREAGAAYAVYGRDMAWEDRRGGAVIAVSYGAGLIDTRWFDGDVSEAWLTDLVLYPNGRVLMNIAGVDSLGNALAEPLLSPYARTRLHLVVRRGEITLVVPPIWNQDETEPYLWQTSLGPQFRALGTVNRGDPSALADVALTPHPDNAFTERAETAAPAY